MIFNAFQREDDDAVFTVAKNVSGTTYSLGEVAVWDSGANADGVRVTQAAAATLGLFRGVCAETILDSGFGKFQVHGYNDDALVNGTATAGDVLLATAAQKYLSGAAASLGNEGFVYAAKDKAGAPTAASAVFIRAL